MASTSVHFPKGLIEALDRAAREARFSRNRIVVDACRAFLERQRRAWPEGFFDDAHLSASELDELRLGGDELLTHIEASRRNRDRAPL